jgi:hypothetical protein
LVIFGYEGDVKTAALHRQFMLPVRLRQFAEAAVSRPQA